MSTATRAPQRPPMDDRIRQRRREVRQASARRRRRMIGWFLLTLLVAAGAVGITRSALFAITGVRVHGVAQAQAETVKAQARIAKGQNLMTANFDAALARTKALPWVADATVRRVPPSTVVIDVEPRRPVAVLRGEQGSWLVDRSGIVIGEATDASLPRIDLVSAVAPVPGAAINDPAAVNALSLYNVLPKDVRAALLALEATGPRTVRVQLALHLVRKAGDYPRGKTTWVRMGTAGNVAEQVAVLRALLEQVRAARQGVPREVDVRVPSNPVVLP